jgi:predicted nucleotidyltransferase
MISDADRDILNLFASRVRERFPDARVWAFGSRARGGAPWDSDFDVCVVLDHLDAATDHTLSDVAWEVGFSHERVITVIPFSRDEFERGPFSESTLAANILREGVPA